MILEPLRRQMRQRRAFFAPIDSACWKIGGKLGQIDDIRWFKGIKFGWYWRLRSARKKSIGKIPGQTDARLRFARAANYEPPIIVNLPEFKVVFPTSGVVLVALLLQKGLFRIILCNE